MTTISSKTIVNRGTGAGGAATNVFGKAFELKTSNEARLLDIGFERGILSGSASASASKRKKQNDYFDYLSKKIDDDKTIIYCTQYRLRLYIKQEYNIDLKRNPDEAYIIKSNTDKSKTVLKILEKKAQNGPGSVFDKLYGGIGIREADYEMPLGEQFDVKYAYCLNNYLKEEYEKHENLKKLNIKYNIDILYGDDENYRETLDAWIYS